MYNGSIKQKDSGGFMGPVDTRAGAVTIALKPGN